MANVSFNVGQEIILVCRNHSVVLPSLFPNEPDTVVYRGIVARRANWDDHDTIRISTGRQFPGIRIIQLASILSVNDVPFEFKPRLQPKKPEPRIVMVQGSAGKQYKITVHPNGSVHCTCPGFGFRGKCSHVDSFLAEEEKK